MNPRSRSLAPALALGAALCALSACSDTHGAGETSQASAAGAGAPAPRADAPLAEYQTQLLELAFDSVSMLPLVPHVKNRARMQEAVVEACLELDQPRRALGYADQIPNWRRGAGLADCAYALAERGERADVQRLLDTAAQVADSDPEAQLQGWRRDNVRAKIARVHLLLGQEAQAAAFEAGLTDSEVGQVVVARAQRVGEDEFEVVLASVDPVAATGNFELLQSRLSACAALFDRFYDDTERRDRAEQKIKSSWIHLPLLMRVELMESLVRASLGHEDGEKALALVEETTELVDSARWLAEDQVALVARLAGLRAEAGDAAGARGEIERALAVYDERQAEIVDIYRADALRPVAEAWQTLGEAALALDVYRRAVDVGAENPNSRPRAEDLSATLCSMALHRVDPDAALWTRIHEVYGALGDPW